MPSPFAGRRLAAVPLLTLALAVPAFASAGPNVTLKLSGALVETVDGQVKRLPLEGVTLKPGDEVEYDVLAGNAGSSAAYKLTPAARIPAGTAYVAGSAKAPDATVQFSLDGGKTWSAAPTITLTTPAGPVTKKADPSRFTSIRFLQSGALAPGAKALYSYEVRVK